LHFSFQVLLAEHCAPTLAGVKPGSLFCWEEAGDMPLLRQELRQWSERLRPYGICFQILRLCREMRLALVYVYRPAWVNRIVRQPAARRFLQTMGYTKISGLQTLLPQLAKRLCLAETFPHEIGLLLGYPLSDVKEFIRQKGKNYLCCGCWKVYQNPDTARQRFRLYQECSRRYRKTLAEEKSFLSLVAAV